MSRGAIFHRELRSICICAYAKWFKDSTNVFFFNITYSLVIAPLPAALDLQKEMQTIKIGLLNFHFFSKNASLR